MRMAANVKAPAIPCAAVVCRKILSKCPTVLLPSSVVEDPLIVVVEGDNVVLTLTFATGTGVGVGVVIWKAQKQSVAGGQDELTQPVECTQSKRHSLLSVHLSMFAQPDHRTSAVTNFSPDKNKALLPSVEIPIALSWHLRRGGRVLVRTAITYVLPLESTSTHKAILCVELQA